MTVVVLERFRVHAFFTISAECAYCCSVVLPRIGTFDNCMSVGKARLGLLRLVQGMVSRASWNCA